MAVIATIAGILLDLLVIFNPLLQTTLYSLWYLNIHGSKVVPFFAVIKNHTAALHEITWHVTQVA